MKGTRVVHVASAVAPAAILLFAPALASAQYVKWLPGEMEHQGPGCPDGSVSAYLVAEGDDFSEVGVMFAGMNVELLAGSGFRNSAGTHCTFSIPAWVAKEIAIGKLTQRLEFYYIKDRGTEGQIYTRSSFFGAPVTPIRVTIPKPNEGMSAFEQAEEDDYYLHWRNRYCRYRRDVEGSLTTRLNVVARRQNTDEEIIVAVPGQTFTYEAMAYWLPCD